MTTATSPRPAATTDAGLIAPHGGELVDRILRGDAAQAARERAQSLPQVTLTDTQIADLEMIAVGAMSPITGFLGRDDYESVVSDIRLADGTVWSLPITLAVDEAPAGDEIALVSPEGQPVGIMQVEEQYDYDKQREAELVYRTTDTAHPGVARLMEQGEILLGGPVELFDFSPNEYGSLLMSPAETRAAFESRGWKRVVGFQTRNPVHRAHEFIIKCALEIVDGLLLHPLVGRTKADDIAADVRMKCYRTLLDNYFPQERAHLSVFPAAMRYAGPREAIFHAMTRKNYGCSHFIVGRDHAGVGDYYGTYDAQQIFDRFTREELGITILRFEHSFWCTRCGGMATAKTCPHPADDRIFLSGTKVREMLANGEDLPVEFTRPEVAAVLAAEARG